MIISFVIEFAVLFVKYLEIKQSIYGLLNIFVTMSMLFGTALNMYLISIKYDYKKVIYYGLFVAVGGCFLLCATGFSMLYIEFSTVTLVALLLCGRVLQGVGHIIMMPYILSTALRDYQHVIGSATAVFNGIYYFVITLITFLTSCLHSDTSIYAFGVMLVSISCLNLLLFRSLEKTS
jgi:polar amino acid transport system substrate-binding protein